MIIGGSIVMNEGNKLIENVNKNKKSIKSAENQFEHTSYALDTIIKGIDVIILNLNNLKNNFMNTELFIEKINRKNNNININNKYQTNYNKFVKKFGFLDDDQKELINYLNKLENKWFKMQQLYKIKETNKFINN